jgi:hypothetical protein
MNRASTFRTSVLAAVLVRCAPRKSEPDGGVPCVTRTSSKPTAFEVTSKRRKGFPSEARVKRGDRVVGGSKELLEKLGRNDPCPCGSGRRFQALLHAHWAVRRVRPRPLLLGKWHWARFAAHVEDSRALPNNSLQRPGTIKCLARGCAMQVGKPTCALIAHRPAAELGR